MMPLKALVNRFLGCLYLLLSFGSNALFAQMPAPADSTSCIAFVPSVTLQNPLHSGVLGVVVLSAAYQEKTRLGVKDDANAGIYFGLGDPERFVGAGVTFNMYGLTNNRGAWDNFGEGAVNLHINKLLLKNKLLLDAGLDNAFGWGGDPVNKQYISYERSFYLSGNYMLQLRPGIKLFHYISLTLGAGNGYFQNDNQYRPHSAGNFNPFFSLATPVLPRTNFIAEWNGYDLGFGFSSLPFSKFPLSLSVEATDLLYGRPRYVATLALPFLISIKRLALKASGRTLVPVKGVRIVRTI